MSDERGRQGPPVFRSTASIGPRGPPCYVGHHALVMHGDPEYHCHGPTNPNTVTHLATSDQLRAVVESSGSQSNSGTISPTRRRSTMQMFAAQRANQSAWTTRLRHRFRRESQEPHRCPRRPTPPSYPSRRTRNHPLAAQRPGWRYEGGQHFYCCCSPHAAQRTSIVMPS